MLVLMVLSGNSSTAMGSIASPKEDEKVGNYVKVTGELSGIPSGHSVWLAVKIGLLLWPKDEILPSEGTWTSAFDEGGDPGKKFGLALIMVGPNGNRQIRQWLEDGPRVGYPGLTHIEDSVRLDAVSCVTLK
jgi:hypothetical protein